MIRLFSLLFYFNLSKESKAMGVIKERKEGRGREREGRCEGELGFEF